MGMKMFRNITVYTGTEQIENGTVTIEGERIQEVRKEETINVAADVFLFPQGYKLVPGFIDVHIHGAAGADVMDENLAALQTIASALPAEGTTSFLATTMTQEAKKIERALMNVREYRRTYMNPGQAEVLGVHLEGPFLSPQRAGAQPTRHMCHPDREQFQKWQEAADGAIRLVTMAPELPDALAFIRYLCESGVTVSVGHSDATSAQVKAAADAGATHATHLFNAMRGLHHREPGVAGAVLLDERIAAELIADGIHIVPEMVQLAWRMKGAEKLLLVTDAMRAKCLGSGTYELGGQQVNVQDGQAILADGTLAGSILRMGEAFANVQAFTGCTLADAVRMAAVNPAKQIGVFDRKGSIEPGKDADLVVLNERDEVVLTMCRGEVAYEFH
ncbi:N-acetylglucosamine 6-phosphate deacetylase [Aneurinibacillus soli]|uniref:N-acetylglucosamine-6-phosphate deacetylase n=1 Tax=Aneurinibacillus soli TaxID=1500254 RepID=A0A0U4WKU4_9BACL|nr:N-acetylglucosamine-6-phosphate deacetylase [Aneurinibacillus soli]PYE62859.1 N-acetylglucosamine 6-phosphate deacetylase [Aneurinibacillus soli]BAU29083.1 N-acetylglucosamine-6-phosphate deacetylase [Aneurinibacillus soli]